MPFGLEIIICKQEIVAFKIMMKFMKKDAIAAKT